MSPRSSTGCFADQPCSVTGLIRHEHLEAVRCHLEDPSFTHRSVAALAA